VGIKQLKITVSDLQEGMYVSKLDRPWTQTPFPLQGFHIRSIKEIEELTHYCRYVFVDVLKSNTGGENIRFTLANPVPVKKKTEQEDRADLGQVYVQVAPITVRREIYQSRVPLKKEKRLAEKFHSEVTSAVKEVFQYIGEGRPLRYQQAKEASRKMVDSIIKNPDAFAWLSRIKEKDEHTYSHSVRSSIWATLFGRHIGLTVQELEDLALGVLLKDVGKIKLEKSLWDLTCLSGLKLEAGKKFIKHSVDILSNTDGVSPRVISVVKHHQERHNGSGFPEGIKGDKIPLLGKLAGIVSCYDEITNPRAQKPLSPTKAIAKLYQTIDVGFQQDIVLEFIKAIGLYPTGTLVELTTGDIGVVIEQNEERRLRPKVMLLIDGNNQRYKRPPIIDLCLDAVSVGSPDAFGKKRGRYPEIDIKRDLEPDAYDIDIASIRDEHTFSFWGVTKLGMTKLGNSR